MGRTLSSSSKHIISRKFKPWRKGKGGIADGESKSKGGSLKNQLRSQRRLLDKLGSNDDEQTKLARDAILAKIKDIEEAISVKEAKVREKKFASK